MNPRVSHVQPASGHRLLLTFTNGEKGIFDCRPYLDFGVFRELQEEHYFRQVHHRRGNRRVAAPDRIYAPTRCTLSQTSPPKELLAR